MASYNYFWKGVQRQIKLIQSITSAIVKPPELTVVGQALLVDGTYCKDASGAPCVATKCL